MAEKPYWVYVLKSDQGKFYIGVTENVAKRLKDHNAGRSKWTSKFRPWNLVWSRGPMSLSAARRLENQLKRQKGGNQFYEMTGLARCNGS